jgi:hypothetical protein
MRLNNCDFKTAKSQVFQIIGRIEPEQWRVVETYEYVDEDGSLLFQVVRRERGHGANCEKDFRQRRPDGNGGWIWNLHGVIRVPYRLPDVLRASTVYLVEGEKDVGTLEGWELVASCNPGGSGSSRFYSRWVEEFRGRHIVIIPDNDKAGHKHAATVASILVPVAASIKVVELPHLPEKGDITDWRDAGGTAEEFSRLVEAAPILDTAGVAELRRHWDIADGSDQGPVPQPSDSSAPTYLPTICVTDRALQDITAEVIEAMKKKNDPPALFVRSGQICRRITDEHRRSKIETLNDHQLRYHIARSAYFERLRKSGPVRISPPRDVVQDVMAHGTWPFPPLDNCVTTPVLRPDGTVLTVPGYDPSTKLLYCPLGPMIMRAVPDTPSEAHLRRARELIEEIIIDFPFPDEASRANALALLLTPILRPAIVGPVPLALVNSPKQGTGKSLLARVTAMIATGVEATLMAAGHDEEEWRKKITATLWSGATIIPIDNIEGVLDSASLAMALTSAMWKDRILGHSEMITIPQLATWIATGNNIVVGGDMGRRSYSIRLDARTERPWMGRTFRHPGLIGWVKEQRLEILWALLTLSRAWYSAGCPAHNTPPLGTFEEWCRVTGGVLAHAGVTCFLGNLEDVYGNVDEDGPQWEQFLQAWYDVNRDNEVTPAELVTQVNFNKGGIRDALPDELALHQNDPGKLRVRLGRALAHRRDSQYGDYRLEKTGQDSHSKAKRWRVVRVQQDGQCRSAPVIPIRRQPDELQISTSAA